MAWTTRPNMVRVISYPDPSFPSTNYMWGLIPTFVHDSIAAPNPLIGAYYSSNTTSISMPTGVTGPLNIASDRWGWPSQHTAPWTLYSGGVTSTDDGYTSVAIPIGFTWYMGGTAYTSLYVSTNGYVTFGSGNGGIYSGTSVPSQNAIMGNPSDQWLQATLAMNTNNRQNIFHRNIKINLNGVVHNIFQLIIFMGRYGNTTLDNSYIINMFSQGTQQLIEVGLRPEAAYTGSVSGPVVPGQSITRSAGERGNTKVWESNDGTGTTWVYNGIGVVVPASKPSLTSALDSGSAGISIKATLHDHYFHYGTNLFSYANTGGFNTYSIQQPGDSNYRATAHTNSTSLGWGIYRGVGQQPTYQVINYERMYTLSLRAYLNNADTSNGAQTYLKNTFDTYTASGQPGYGYNLFNTTNSGVANSVSLTDVLNYQKTYLRKVWTSGGQSESYWEARLENFIYNVTLPAITSGSIANGYLWSTAVPPVVVDPRIAGARLRAVTDAYSSSAPGSPGIATPAADPFKVSSSDFSNATIPSGSEGYINTNYLAVGVYNKKFHQVAAGTASSLNKWWGANGTTFAISDTKDLYAQGIYTTRYVGGSPDGITGMSRSYLSLNSAYASASYKPLSNTTFSTSTTGATLQISNQDGSANSLSPLTANLNAQVNVTDSQVGLVLSANGTILYTYAYGGTSVANTNIPTGINMTSQNTVAYRDAHLGAHIGVSFAGNITVGTNHTVYVLDADNPYRASQAVSSFYYNLAQRNLALSCVAANTSHFLGTGITSSNGTTNAAIGTSSSIVGTLTFRNNLTNVTMSRAIDIRLNVIA